jgi:protein-L-isoaspartate(D-aspartate) O-methyltransferase
VRTPIFSTQLGGEERDAVAARRARMVEEQVRRRGIRDERVLAALEQVPRHSFVPDQLEPHAYEDRPLPIGHGQTISQPYIVAYMTEKLALRPGARVLDIGTGSGYHAAILARVAVRVVSVEVVPELAARARARLARLGFANVSVHLADGALGWPADAPYDGILVACGAPSIPPALVRQLAPRARLIMPVGTRDGGQDLVIVEKDEGGRTIEWPTIEVRFVPLTGPSGEPPAG